MNVTIENNLEIIKDQIEYRSEILNKDFQEIISKVKGLESRIKKIESDENENELDSNNETSEITDKDKNFQDFTEETIKLNIFNFQNLWNSEIDRVITTIKDSLDSLDKIEKYLKKIISNLEKADLKENMVNCLVKKGVPLKQAFEAIYEIPFDPNKRLLRIRGNHTLEIIAILRFRRKMENEFNKKIEILADELRENSNGEMSRDDALKQASDTLSPLLQDPYSVPYPDSIFDDVYLDIDEIEEMMQNLFHPIGE